MHRTTRMHLQPFSTTLLVQSLRHGGSAIGNTERERGERNNVEQKNWEK